MSTTNAKTRASNKYNKANTKTYCFRFNRKTDADIIEKLERQTSKQGYIKSLIRAESRIAEYFIREELEL